MSDELEALVAVLGDGVRRTPAAPRCERGRPPFSSIASRAPGQLRRLRRIQACASASDCEAFVQRAQRLERLGLRAACSRARLLLPEQVLASARRRLLSLLARSTRNAFTPSSTRPRSRSIASVRSLARSPSISADAVLAAIDGAETQGHERHPPRARARTSSCARAVVSSQSRFSRFRRSGSSPYSSSGTRPTIAARPPAETSSTRSASDAFS